MTVMTGGTVVIKNDESVFAVNPATGRELWRVPSSENETITVTNELAVRRDAADSDSGPIDFVVIDPSTGETLWDGGPVDDLLVTQDAIFSGQCKQGTKGNCTVTRREPRSGKVVWKVPSDQPWFGDEFIGVRRPMAPATSRYVVSGYDPATGEGARDIKSGRMAKGRVPSNAWYDLVAGQTLVTTNHDPPEGDDRCTVQITAVDIESGRHIGDWEVFSGRRASGECRKELVPRSTGLMFIGEGSRIAASTQGGKPQVFDLESGDTVWRGDTRGVPIDGDGRTLLVREHADTGGLRLLDFDNGHTLWTAPDPGLSGLSASWGSEVTENLVAVSGATGDRPYVLVYRVKNGRLLGRFPGWLQGLGDDWVAVSHSADVSEDKLTLDFIRF